MKRLIHQMLFLGLLLPLMLLMSACSKQEPALSTSDKPPLKIAWSLWPGYSPFIIAHELELFAKHGVAVEPIFYDVSSKQLPDFEAGKLDGGFFAFADALTIDARSQGTARLVLVTDNSDGADVIVASPEIEEVADLRGKHIGTGIGSFRELLVRQMLEAHGLRANDVTLVNMGPEQVPEALPDAIQAGQTWEPFASEALDKGNYIIFSSADTPGLIPDVLLFQGSLLEERSDDVRAVIKAWFEALDYWLENPEEGNAIIAGATNREPAQISTEGLKLFTLEDNLNAFEVSSQPTSLYVSGQLNADFMISTGVLVNAPELKRLLDPGFLK